MRRPKIQDVSSGAGIGELRVAENCTRDDSSSMLARETTDHMFVARTTIKLLAAVKDRIVIPPDVQTIVRCARGRGTWLLLDGCKLYHLVSLILKPVYW